MANVKRSELLKVLDIASIGLTTKAILEQSDSFVFSNGRVITFNDSVFVRAKVPVPFNAVVPASDFLTILNAMPDEDLDIALCEHEVVVKGKRRTAGISCSEENRLAIDTIPDPAEWAEIGEGVQGILKQAARVCGVDETLPNTTVVHVTPDLIEACDNFRFFRCTLSTGFAKDVKVPASALDKVTAKVSLKAVAVGQNWVFFKGGGAFFAVRAEHGSYHKGLEKLFDVDGGRAISLPGALPAVLERARTMNDASYDSNVIVHIEDGEVSIKAQKEGGWYKESKKISFSGKPLTFRVHPDFLREVLALTLEVTCTDRRMKLERGAQVFVVSLQSGSKPTAAVDED